MIRLLKRATLLAVLSLCGLAPQAAAQAFPDHVLKLVVPFPPGGATDVLGRLLAKKMSDILGQPIIVENHGGAGGTIGTEFASRQAAPDGYTVVLVSALAQGASKKLYPTIKYDPVKSFAPIGSLGALSYVLVVNPNLGITSLDGLIKAMKATPEKFNYASAGVGSAPHLAVELFLRAADVKATHVPYQGSAPALTGVVAGDTQFAIDNVAAVPLIKAGKLRRTRADRKTGSAHLPDVPTFTEAGLPQFDVTATWGLLAPAGVPAPIVAKLNEALVRAAERSAVARIAARAGHHARRRFRPAVRHGARQRDRTAVEADRRREDSAMTRGSSPFGELSPLLAARSVAVVGASDRDGNLGGIAIGFLRSSATPARCGRSIPVAPRSADCPASRACASCRRVPDLAILAVPAASIVDVVKDCVDAGVPAASHGRAVLPKPVSAGRARQRELEAVCSGAGSSCAAPTASASSTRRSDSPRRSAR